MLTVPLADDLSLSGDGMWHLAGKVRYAEGMTQHPGPIVVAGATGNQGGAAARQLLAQGWTVRALTRNPDSDAARRLQAAGAEILQAEFLDRPSLTRALEGAYGAFSVQAVQPLGTAVETIQGYAFADAAKAAGVRHLVYSSIGGADRASGVGHYESKWKTGAGLSVVDGDLLGVKGSRKAWGQGGDKPSRDHHALFVLGAWPKHPPDISTAR